LNVYQTVIDSNTLPLQTRRASKFNLYESVNKCDIQWTVHHDIFL